MPVARIHFNFKGTGPNTAALTDFDDQKLLPKPLGAVLRVVSYLVSTADAQVWLQLDQSGSTKEGRDTVPVFQHNPLWLVAPAVGGVAPPDWYLPLPATGPGTAHRAVCKLEWWLDQPYSLMTCACEAAVGVDWAVAGVLVVDCNEEC